jgi:subtilisin family serine protease
MQSCRTGMYRASAIISGSDRPRQFFHLAQEGDALGGSAIEPMSNDVFSNKLVVEVRRIERSSIGDISRNANVIAVAPDIPVFLVEAINETSPPALPDHEVAWGVKTVRADTSPFAGAGIVVAVLDTGIDRNHAAFAGMELVEKDFTGEGNGDSVGHGTHCAGTSGNGFGRIGVAPGVGKALIGKIIGKNKGGSSKTIASAIQWAVERMVQMSFPCQLESTLSPWRNSWKRLKFQRRLQRHARWRHIARTFSCSKSWRPSSR